MAAKKKPMQTRKAKAKALAPPVPVSAPQAKKRAGGRERIGLYPHVDRSRLADKLNLSVSLVSKILLGKRRANLAVALKIAKACGVSPEQLDLDWQARHRSAPASSVSHTAHTARY